MKMPSTRRTFLASIGLAASLPVNAASTRVRAGCMADADTFENLMLVLREMKGLGYTGFAANLRLLQTQSGRLAEAREQFADIGLDLIGVRTTLPRYNEMENDRAMDELSRIAMAAKQFGARTIMLHSAGLAPDGKFTPEALTAKTKFFNQAAKRCGETGVYFNYRTQDTEFLNEAAEIKALVDHTEKNVYFDLDLSRATRYYAGAIDFFGEHPDRTFSLEAAFGDPQFRSAHLATAIKRTKWISWLIENSDKPGEVARTSMKKAFGV